MGSPSKAFSIQSLKVNLKVSKQNKTPAADPAEILKKKKNLNELNLYKRLF